MFISRKRWEEIQNEIDHLKSCIGNYECKLEDLELAQRINTSKIKRTFISSCGTIDVHDSIPLTQAVSLILDHLKLKIDETPAKVGLVPKDNA